MLFVKKESTYIENDEVISVELINRFESFNDGKRLGGSQEPAYARILTEIYLDGVIDGILEPISSEHNQSFKLFRYVDDIVVFCENETAASNVYDTLVNGFFTLNLPVNMEKSQYYGCIAELDDNDRDATWNSAYWAFLLFSSATRDKVFRVRKFAVKALANPMEKGIPELLINPILIALSLRMENDLPAVKCLILEKQPILAQYGGLLVDGIVERGKIDSNYIVRNRKRLYW